MDMSINIKGVCVSCGSAPPLLNLKKRKKTQDPEFRTVKGFEPFKPF